MDNNVEPWTQESWVSLLESLRAENAAMRAAIKAYCGQWCDTCNGESKQDCHCPLYPYSPYPYNEDAPEKNT